MGKELEYIASQQLSELAYEKGFRGKCLGWYFRKGCIREEQLSKFHFFSDGEFCDNNNPSQIVSAPLREQLVEWLRDKNIHVTPNLYLNRFETTINKDYMVDLDPSTPLVH